MYKCAEMCSEQLFEFFGFLHIGQVAVCFIPIVIFVGKRYIIKQVKYGWLLQRVLPYGFYAEIFFFGGQLCQVQRKVFATPFKMLFVLLYKLMQHGYACLHGPDGCMPIALPELYYRVTGNGFFVFAFPVFVTEKLSVFGCGYAM